MQAPSPNDLHLGRAGVGLAAEIAEIIGRGVESPAVSAAGVAFLIDVAGMDESKTSLASSLASEGLGNPGRDSTTLTIVGIDLSSLAELNHPTYRVLARHAWTGQNHLAVFGQIKNLAEQWSPQHMVIDATGVGEGLWALLDRSFPTRVIPVKFTSQEKSEIGWRFISIIETGRFHDPDPSDEVRLQYSHCISEILPGPPKPSAGVSPTAPAVPMANSSTTTTSLPMPSLPSWTVCSGVSRPLPSLRKGCLTLWNGFLRMIHPIDIQWFDPEEK